MEKSNKRRNRRWELKGVFNVYDVNTNTIAGRLKNISTGGFMLSSHRELEFGRLYQLKIAFTASKGQQHYISMDAECVWNSSSISPPRHQMGFKIIDPEKSIQDTLKMFINEFKM